MTAGHKINFGSAEIPVFLTKFAKGYPEHGAAAGRATYGPLTDALEETFTAADAHFAAYSCPDKPYRLAGHDALACSPQMVAFIVDVDAPDKQATNEWWASERAKIEKLFKARGSGYAYRTRGGARIVYGLRNPLELRSVADTEKWSASYSAWLKILRNDFEIVGDAACSDWPRMYRLPRVMRDGEATVLREDRAGKGALGSIIDIRLDEVGWPYSLGDWHEPYVEPPAKLSPPPAPSAVEGLAAEETAIDDAIRSLGAAWPATGRHLAQRALAGALVQLEKDDDKVAEFIAAVCEIQQPGNGDVAKRRQTVRDSRERLDRGEKLEGWGSLAQRIGSEAVDAVKKALDIREIDLFALAIEQAKPTLAQQLDAACAEMGGDASFRALIEEAAEKLAPIINLEEAKADRPIDPRPMGLRGREMLARNLPPPEYLVDSLITREGVGALSGEPKSAKSWDATHITVAVASGRPVFGRFAVQKPVATFYLYLEDPESSVNNRRNAIAVGMGIPKDGEWLDNWYAQPRGRVIDILNLADLCVLVASVWRYEREDKKKIELVVIDPLSNAHSGEEDKRDSMKLVMARLHAVEMLLGAGILFTHHSSKTTAESKGRKRGGQKMRGSGAIHGAVDYAIYLDDLRGNTRTEFTARIESEVKSAAQAGVFDRTLLIEDDANGHAIKATFTAADRAPESKPVDLADQRAVTVVQKLFDQGAPMTRDELKRKISGDAAILEAAIDIAKSEGWIDQRFQGKRSAGYVITNKGREFIRHGQPNEAPQQNVAPPDHLKSWALAEGKS